MFILRRTTNILQIIGNKKFIGLFGFSQAHRVLRSYSGINDQSISQPTLHELPSWDRGGKTIKNSLTPLYSSIRGIIDSHPGSVCLVQVGSFYEIYFEQAELYGPKLGLKVASRKTNSNIISMAGFPLFQLQKFVKILVQEICVSVAVIDQYPDFKKSMNSLIHRKVSRIISPGTLVDETFINYNQNNYLVSISFPPNCTKVPADEDLQIGLAWVDLTVGESYVQLTSLSSLSSDISRINPSEIILSKDLQIEELSNSKWYPELQTLNKYFIRYHNTLYLDLKSQFRSRIQITEKAFEQFSVREIAAMNMVLSYVRYNLPEADPKFDLPIKYWNKDSLQMDPRTRESLELTERAATGYSAQKGTLLSSIKRTVTPSGTRLLTKWIKSPILDTEELLRRQKLVEVFKKHNFLRIELRSHLSELGDFIRHLQHIIFKNDCNAYPLAQLADGILRLKNIEDFLRKNVDTLSFSDGMAVKEFLSNFAINSTTAKMIMKALAYSNMVMDNKTEGPEQEINDFQSNKEIEQSETSNSKSQFGYEFQIKRNHNDRLKQLHMELDILLSKEKEILESVSEAADDKQKISVKKKLQIGKHFNVIYVLGKEKSINFLAAKIPEGIKEKRKGSLILRTNEWIYVQNAIEDIVQTVKEVEKKIIEDLRAQVLEDATIIRSWSRKVDVLDVISSFAVLTIEKNLVCPKFSNTPVLKIRGGRHIVVESALSHAGEIFTPNDTALGNKEKVWVVSGPNMGGKSTFLRQNALIVILAQIGCYVPAEKVSLGIVDKLFTRIGASDDLFSDLSTFMVEMIETSNIINTATPNSLAIVDEVGRGTSGKEGLAIAYATLVNLLKTNKCRTLFATHFAHELNNLLLMDEINAKKLGFYRECVQAIESKGKEIFVMNHKLEPGISEKSYALEIAKKAGFPAKALNTASRALSLIHKSNL